MASAGRGSRPTSEIGRLGPHQPPTDSLVQMRVRGGGGGRGSAKAGGLECVWRGRHGWKDDMMMMCGVWDSNQEGDAIVLSMRGLDEMGGCGGGKVFDTVRRWWWGRLLPNLTGARPQPIIIASPLSPPLLPSKHSATQRQIRRIHEHQLRAACSALLASSSPSIRALVIPSIIFTTNRDDRDHHVAAQGSSVPHRLGSPTSQYLVYTEPVHLHILNLRPSLRSTPFNSNLFAAHSCFLWTVHHPLILALSPYPAGFQIPQSRQIVTPVSGAESPWHCPCAKLMRPSAMHPRAFL